MYNIKTTSNNKPMDQQAIVLDSNSLIPSDRCLGGAYVTGIRKGTIVANPNLKEWDGKPLQEDIVYHRQRMLGLPLCSIKENRDSQSRAKYWQKICRENGMTNSAIFVKAKIAKEAGFTPAIYQKDIKDWWIVPENLLENYYLPLDGNGRTAGHDLDLKEAMSAPNYIPFDFSFVYKELENPDLFFKQYISTNLDVKKTTKSELLRYTSCRKPGSTFNNYYALQSEGFVAKAAAYYIFGRELTRNDIKKTSEGHDITEKDNLVECMGELLETYKDVFSAGASQKVLKGVPLALWTRNTLNKAGDMKAMANKIADKFLHMSPRLLGKLQDAKGVKGDRTKTKEIVLIGIFNEILNK